MSTSRIRTVLQDWIAERTTPTLTLSLVDEDGDAITSVTAITLAIHQGGEVVRARASVADDFSAGTLSVRLAPEDTRILGSGSRETHTALIEWTWDSGTRHGKHEVIYTVANFALVPAS